MTCPLLSVPESNTVNVSGVFDDKVNITCNPGYHVNKVNDSFSNFCGFFSDTHSVRWNNTHNCTGNFHIYQLNAINIKAGGCPSTNASDLNCYFHAHSKALPFSKCDWDCASTNHVTFGWIYKRDLSGLPFYKRWKQIFCGVLCLG